MSIPIVDPADLNDMTLNPLRLVYVAEVTNPSDGTSRVLGVCTSLEQGRQVLNSPEGKALRAHLGDFGADQDDPDQYLRLYPLDMLVIDTGVLADALDEYEEE